MAIPPELGEIVYVFPRARARNVEEMHLSMTMQGSAEPHGDHRVVTIDDTLVAVYEGEAGDGGAEVHSSRVTPRNASKAH